MTQQQTDCIQLLISLRAILQERTIRTMPVLNPMGNLTPPMPLQVNQDIEEDTLWQTAVRIARNEGVEWDWVLNNF